MSARVLLYGATGFTGQALARQLSGQFGPMPEDELGLVRTDRYDLVLAGRNAGKVRALAESLNLPWRAFDLANAAEARSALADIGVVIHAAGPFMETAQPMVEACLATGTHYLDLGGEWPVYPAIMARHVEALEAGITLMPGVGLTVGATECLLLRAAEHWPDTERLCLGISAAEVISRGSVETMARLAEAGTLIRRGGELVRVPAGSLTRMFDFGQGPSEAAATNWAEVVTAGETTGVRDIEVYSQMHWSQRAGYRAAGIAMGLAGPGLFRSAGGLLAKTWPQEPDPAQRAEARFIMVVEALDPWRRVRRMAMQTLDGYGATVRLADEALGRVLQARAPIGFTTPARAFGSNFAVEAGAALFCEPDRSTAA